LVEAIIVEISEDKFSELGVQWAALGKSGFAISELGLSPGPGALLAAANGSTDDAISALAGTSGFNVGFADMNDDTGFSAILKAIATDTDSNILSTPSLITMDNEPASILVGEERSFKTGDTTSSNNDNPFTTFTRKKIGLKLEITPQINEGDAVRLNIYQEVSGVKAGQGGSEATTNQREITTTVLVQDGATVVLGGLIDEQHSEVISKVPLLGDIPYLGELFKTRSVAKNRRNLMVFIHPTIIRDDKMLNEISGQKYSFIRQEQLDIQKEGISLMMNESPALLPRWDKSEVLPWQN